MSRGLQVYCYRRQISLDVRLRSHLPLLKSPERFLKLLVGAGTQVITDDLLDCLGLGHCNLSQLLERAQSLLLTRRSRCVHHNA